MNTRFRNVILIGCSILASTAAAQSAADAVAPDPSEVAAGVKESDVVSDAPRSGWFSRHWGIRVDLQAAYPLSKPTNAWYDWGGAWRVHGYLDLTSFLDLGLEVGQIILSPAPKATNRSLGGSVNIDVGLRLKRPMSMGHLVSPFFEIGTGVAITGDNQSGGTGPRWDIFAGVGVLFRGHHWPVWIGPSMRVHQIFAWGSPKTSSVVADATILTFGLTVDFNAGGADWDHDGVENIQDLCAATPGQASNAGCPSADMDGDGVPDSLDKCPTVPGAKSGQGCPDADGDGVPDAEDKCPNVRGVASAMGCPDADGDRVADGEDKCPNVAGSPTAAGCPDEDGDGVPDSDDKCPGVKGAATAAGCPDEDGDGIQDSEDKCPKLAGTAELQGCLDTDGDGVMDDADLCPKVAGPASNNGCPAYKSVTVSADKLTLKQKIIFAVGGSKIQSRSSSLMKEISSVLMDRGDTCVRIEGHTDSTGSAEKNQKLSEDRAESVREALVKSGISMDRLSVQGFGQDQPIDSNATAAGRENNRRVEFVTTECRK